MHNDDSWPRPSVPYSNLDRMVMVPKEKESDCLFSGHMLYIFPYTDEDNTKNTFGISEKKFE